MKRKFASLPVVLTPLLLSHPTAAHAYLDPGTGSLILQGLLAAIAGALVTIKLYWFKLQIFWNRLTSRETPHSESTTKSTESDQAEE